MSIWEFEYIDVDLKNEENILSGKCKQGDTLTFNFNVYEAGVVADLTNISMLIKANKADKGYEIRDTNITISGNLVKIKCPASITQFAGDLKLELCFMDTASGLQKSSFDIVIKVKKSVIGNTDGSVPPVIMTELQRLEESLASISANINQAENIANTLNNASNNASTSIANINNAIGNGNLSITNINNTTSIANSAKSNLDSSIGIANTLKGELLNQNSAINQHLNNLDIHVTKDKKDKWDSYEARITELTNIIDNYIYLDALVTDDNENNVTDDNENTVII